MEFREYVQDVLESSPPLKKIIMDGDAKIELELPISLLNININKNMKIIVNLNRDREENYKDKYNIYMWGILYYKNNNYTYISIGGLILKLSKDIPFNIGEKIYIGIKISS